MTPPEVADRPRRNATTRFSDDQLLMTARLYYVDGLPQADVARLMKVSQPQVSRILALAKERGIVRISVADYDPRDRELEKQLYSQLGLKNPIVIKTVRKSLPEELRRTVAHFAAAEVAMMIQQARLVSVSGGRSLREVVRLLQAPHRESELVVIQSMGNIGSVPGVYDGLELGRQIAAAWGGAFYMLNTPAFLPDMQTRDSILSLGENQSVVKRFNQVDLALVGVGTLENSVFAARGVLQDKDLRPLRKAGAVGEICGRFFDANGREVDTFYKDRVASIHLDQLKRIRNVVAVISGEDRALAVRSAIRGGLVKCVVIDDSGARALLAA